MKVTKSSIAAVLKDQGLGFVKMSTGISYADTTKCFKDGAGKRVKGIRAASHGPMTVTDEYQKAITAKMTEVEAALLQIGMEYVDEGLMVANKDAKRPLKLSLNVEWFPAYTRAANLDEGYKNIYIVPTYF